MSANFLKTSAGNHRSRGSIDTANFGYSDTGLNIMHVNQGTGQIEVGSGVVQDKGDTEMKSIKGNMQFSGSIDTTNFPITNQGKNVIWRDGANIKAGYDYIADGSLNTSTTDAVPTMTSDTAPSGEAKASSFYAAGSEAYQVFNNDGSSSQWVTASTVTGWLEYKFDIAIAINKYTLLSSNDLTRMCKDWTIQGSDTGAFAGEEIIVDTVTGETGWNSTTPRTFTMVNGTEYLYYRINITLNDGDSTYLSIGEMELIATEKEY